MKLLLIIIAFQALHITNCNEAVKLMQVEYYGMVFNEYCGVSYQKGTQARAFNKFCEK
jgi:hypothetical protein